MLKTLLMCLNDLFYDFNRLYFYTFDMMLIMIKNNSRIIDNFFQQFDFFDSNFFFIFIRITNDFRNFAWFFTFSKNIFVFVQIAQLKFRKMIEIVIDIFENKKIVAKHHTWCRIIYNKVDDEYRVNKITRNFQTFSFILRSF